MLKVEIFVFKGQNNKSVQIEICIQVLLPHVAEMSERLILCWAHDSV